MEQKYKNYKGVMQLTIRGNNINLTRPKVMGIVNTTPDSFYKGSRNQSDKELLTTVEKMLQDGADFIDLGGYSTRPDALEVHLAEEIERTTPKIKSIINAFPKTIISIDTFRAEVAKSAVENGALIINDVTGGNGDENMFKTVADLDVPYILMHMRGTPKTMQSITEYIDIIDDLKTYFKTKVESLKLLGVKDIVLDLGYGFSKTLEQNYFLLKNQHQFLELGLPILTGVSRKSMIYKQLNVKQEEALNGTTALNMIALQNGASILRVHDVKEARQTVELFELLKD